MAYHYLDSGLENIYLENGYTEHDTPYGKGISVQNTAGLHRVIGVWLVSRPVPLVGAELRFLRLEMELAQRDLAAVLGTTEQTLRLWERNKRKDIPGPADRLVRALYSERATGDASVRRIVERLAQLDVQPRVDAHLRETAEGWQVEGSDARGLPRTSRRSVDGRDEHGHSGPTEPR